MGITLFYALYTPLKFLGAVEFTLNIGPISDRMSVGLFVIEIYANWVRKEKLESR